MTSKKLLLLILLFASSCVGKTDQEVGCSEFEFDNLNKDTNKWNEEVPFENITESFFSENQKALESLNHFDSKNIFHVCDIKTDKLNGTVVATLNGPTWDMYFVPKSEGQTFMVACVEAGPDEYIEKRSQLIDKGLKMTTIHMNEGAKDSIVSYYSVNKNRFERIKSDSVRISSPN